ncbi:MAG TPA: GAF domain-containing sensor histidine kinase [Candidatus Acidoferrales bacterium]|jgi:signal transduction histidine kinase|nr:GAF domain-containing sensor histidine kinase [Candidatus Acidoferrales bacterium]
MAPIQNKNWTGALHGFTFDRGLEQTRVDRRERNYPSFAENAKDGESAKSQANAGPLRGTSTLAKPPAANPQTQGDLEFGFLHEIAMRLSHAPPLHEILREVVRFVAAVVECDSCFVYVLEKDELVLRASKNPHPEIIDRLKLKMGEGITGWVAEHREPVAVPQNAMKDPRFKFFNDLPEDRFQAFLSVPLMSRGRLVGVINLQNRKAHTYTKREISMISTVCTMAGAEIEMARLQDEERRRIGRELHDSLGQELTAAKLFLRRIPADSFADGHWASHVKEAADAVDRALQRVRSLSYLLHPPFAEDMGLLTALRYYVEGVSQRTGIQINTGLPKEMAALPFEVEAAIFRFVQEALTNVYRHSDSKTVDVELTRNSKNVHIKVRDYGSGKPASAANPDQPNAGISGIRERVHGLGGNFRIYDASPGTGVEAVLPVSAADARLTAKEE